MPTEQPRRRTGRRAAAAVVLAGALVVAPAVAEAAFIATATTNVAGGRTSATTMTLASPSPNVVTSTCALQGVSGKYRLTLTVVSHGSVARANAYTLTVYDTSGATLATTTDLSQSTSYTTAPGLSWKYSIDAVYKVNSINSWHSNSPQIAVNCPV